jgi:hypothetical protein
MTQPPGGYPPPEPGDRHPPPADPFYAPPSWEPPTPYQSSYPPPPPPASPPPPPTNPYTAPTSPYLPPGSTVPMAAPGSPPPSSPYGPPGGGPPYGPPGGAPPYPPGPPPRRRRRWLVIGTIALAGALVLCAGGGVAAWLLTRDPDRNGAESPTVAVQSFLQAVYHNQNAAQAADMVCAEARDEASLETKINEIKTYQETEVNPTFEWTEPAVVEEREQLAIVAVTVTMTTGDEKTADQNLQVSVLDKESNGWWVCDLETVDTASTPPPEDQSSTPPPSESPSEEGE